MTWKRFRTLLAGGVFASIGLAVIAVLAFAPSFDSQRYRMAVQDRFDDGEIMNTEQARCVADDFGRTVDWEALSHAGVEPDEVFGDDALTERISSADIDSLVGAIDRCRGATEVVLSIFNLDGGLPDEQMGCFASRITATSARDLLRLIVADDVGGFRGSDGEVLLATCSV